MNEERLNKLKLILEKLRGIPGVRSVESDDFDSTSVNVFITLYNGSVGIPYRFANGIRSVKSLIKRTCLCRFLSQPRMQYAYSGRGYPKWRMGYDSSEIKIELFV